MKCTAATIRRVFQTFGATTFSGIIAHWATQRDGRTPLLAALDNEDLPSQQLLQNLLQRSYIPE